MTTSAWSACGLVNTVCAVLGAPTNQGAQMGAQRYSVDGRWNILSQQYVQRIWTTVELLGVNGLLVD